MSDRPPNIIDNHGHRVDARTGSVVSDHQVDRVFQQLQSTIQESYTNIKTDHSGRDNGVAGDAHETLWVSVFREWFPEFPSATKVSILMPDGEYSPEVDLVLLERGYPRPLLERKMILSAGVVAAFECKLTFYQTELTDILKKAAVVKRGAGSNLDPKRSLYRYLYGKFPYGLLASSHEWKAPGSNPFANIQKHFDSKHRTAAKHPRELIDLICVADIAHWASVHFTLPQLAASGHFRGEPGGISSALGGSSVPAVAGLFLDLIHRLNKMGKVDGWFREFVSQATGHSGTTGGLSLPWQDDTFPEELIRDIKMGKVSLF